MGCDIWERDSGLVGAGRGAFPKHLKSVDTMEAVDLTPRSFAIKLREFSRTPCWLQYSTRQVTAELNRVAQWVSFDSTYYDTMGNIRSVAGHLTQAQSPVSHRHMKGLVNAKTLAGFNTNEKRHNHTTYSTTLLLIRRTSTACPSPTAGTRWPRAASRSSGWWLSPEAVVSLAVTTEPVAKNSFSG